MLQQTTPRVYEDSDFIDGPATPAKQPRVYEDSDFMDSAPSFNDERTASEVMSDQAAHVLRGIPQAITGIPSFLSGTASALGQALTGGGTGKAQEMLKGMAKPFETVGRGAGSLITPDRVQSPSREEFEGAAQASGAMLGSAALPNVVSGTAKAAGAVIPKSIPRSIYESTSASALKSMERALDPRGRELKAIAQEIAPELIDRGVFEITGGKLDQTLRNNMTQAGIDVIRAENAIPPQTPVPMSGIRAGIQSTINDLTIKLDQGEISGHPEAVAELQNALADVTKFGDQARFNDLIRYRRQLDQGIQESGGYRNASSAADKIRMLARRSVADNIRAEINGMSKELARANADYHLYRKANDIVDWRDLNAVGEHTPTWNRLIRGRSDDAAAMALGYMGGGAAGALGVEGVNLLRQLRGFQSTKSQVMSGIAGRAANMFAETRRSRLLPEQGEGRPFQMGAPRTSKVTGEQAPTAPATREIRTGRLIPERTGAPYAGRQGFPLEEQEYIPSPSELRVTTGRPLSKDVGGGISVPEGGKSVRLGKMKMTFLGTIPDPLTGKPAKWVYQDPSGQQVTFASPLY